MRQAAPSLHYITVQQVMWNLLLPKIMHFIWVTPNAITEENSSYLILRGKCALLGILYITGRYSNLKHAQYLINKLYLEEIQFGSLETSVATVDFC